MSVNIHRYRPTVVTIEAFEYAGEFPLSFLCAGETVRKASAAGSPACVVRQGDDEVTVHLHEYVVRDLSTGRIRAVPATGWFSDWEFVESVRRGS